MFLFPTKTLENTFLINVIKIMMDIYHFLKLMIGIILLNKDISIYLILDNGIIRAIHLNVLSLL